MHAARARSLPSRRAAYNAYCMYPYYPSLSLSLNPLHCHSHGRGPPSLPDMRIQFDQRRGGAQQMRGFIPFSIIGE